MDWVSFDEIKKTVSLKMVIEHYGWPLRNGGVNVLRGKCPLPTHGSDKSKESFIATLDKGTGGAWSCHSNSCAAARGGKKGGNVLDLVAAMENCSIRDAAIKLQLWFLVPAAGGHPPKQPETDNASATKGDEQKLFSKGNGAGETPPADEPNKPLTFALKSIDPAHPYLATRGLTEETIRTFGIGYFSGKGSMANRVVIPIHNKRGELVAYAGRSIDGTEPRYKFPAGFHKSQELYNLHRVKDEVSVVIVEGFFDCMKVSQAGYPCVALMGSSLSKAQERLLVEHNFGEVVLMLDGDEAGRNATEEIADRLQGVIFSVKTIELGDSKQPDQHSANEICAVLNGVL
jgi:DNA primase